MTTRKTTAAVLAADSDPDSCEETTMTMLATVAQCTTTAAIKARKPNASKWSTLKIVLEAP